MRHYPEFTSIAYFPASDAVMEAALSGEVTAGCGQEQTSKDGFHRGTQARISAPGSKLYVVAEISQRYQCSLLCKPGGTVEQVRRVLGHTGSIASPRPPVGGQLPRGLIENAGTKTDGGGPALVGGGGAVAPGGRPDLARGLGVAAGEALR